MKRIITAALAVSTLCITAACTQNPVNVAYKGGQFFGPNGQQMAAVTEHAPVRHSKPIPAATAHVQSRELPPIRNEQAHSFAAPRPVITPVVTHNRVEVKPLAPIAPVKVAALPARLPETREEVYVPPRTDWSSKAHVPQFGQVGLSKQISDAKPQFIWPVHGEVISGFGPKQGGERNDGINIAAPEGEPIFAAADGMVAYAGNELPGYGNMIILRHTDGWMTAYAHASGLMVQKAEQVRQGDLIAYVGATGGVKSAQLHFGLREGTRPVNPTRYLARDVAGLN